MSRTKILPLALALAAASCGESPPGVLGPDAPVRDAGEFVMAGLTLEDLASLRDGVVMSHPRPAVVLAAAPPAPPVSPSVTVDFEDGDATNDGVPIANDRYDALGLSILTDDGSIWDGSLADPPDPGHWGLTGSNGDQFLGFNGSSDHPCSAGPQGCFAATVLLGEGATSLSVDVAGVVSLGDQFHIVGYCDDVEVESHDLLLAMGGGWTTLTVGGACVDEVRWWSSGGDFRFYAVDNVQATFEVADDGNGDGNGDGADADADGVPDDVDMCAETVVPDEFLLPEELGVNRFALVDEDDVFDTVAPEGEGFDDTFTLADTGGCNAQQIAEAMHLGEGQYRFGLAVGVMRRWVAMVAAAAEAAGDGGEDGS